MRNGFAFSLSLCLLAASPAIAHDTLPPEWCPVGTTATIVAQFDLPPQALADYRALHANDGHVLGSVCDSPKTCGIVDDWFWANEAAHESCTDRQRRGSVSLQAMPFVTYPTTFNLDSDTGPNGIPNGIKDHHDQYKFKSGLKGVCVVCTPHASPAPAEAAPNR